MEVRRIGEQNFLSPERDLLVIFLPMCKSALITAEYMMNDLDDEALKKELRFVLDSIKAYRYSIYTEDVESDVIAKRLWNALASTRGGKLFLGNLAFGLIDMFIDASRRSVQKPDLAVDQIDRALTRDRILASVPDDLRTKVSMALAGPEGFGEFVPGMYEKETDNDNT